MSQIISFLFHYKRKATLNYIDEIDFGYHFYLVLLFLETSKVVTKPSVSFLSPYHYNHESKQRNLHEKRRKTLELYEEASGI